MGTRASTWHRDLHQPVPFIVLAASFTPLLRLQTKIAASPLLQTQIPALESTGHFRKSPSRLAVGTGRGACSAHSLPALAPSAWDVRSSETAGQKLPFQVSWFSRNSLHQASSGQKCCLSKSPIQNAFPEDLGGMTDGT